jgi:hypothetical protein
MLARARTRAHTQVTSEVLALLIEILKQRGVQTDDAAGVPLDKSSRTRQTRSATARAVEQLGAQAPFELVDLMGDSRLGHADLLSCLGEATAGIDN